MRKPKKNNPPAGDEESLMKLTEDALADVLGRNPTKQEVLLMHVGFKRMAFMLNKNHGTRAKT